MIRDYPSGAGEARPEWRVVDGETGGFLHFFEILLLYFESFFV